MCVRCRRPSFVLPVPFPPLALGFKAVKGQGRRGEKEKNGQGQAASRRAAAKRSRGAVCSEAGVLYRTGGWVNHFH